VLLKWIKQLTIVEIIGAVMCLMIMMDQWLMARFVMAMTMATVGYGDGMIDHCYRSRRLSSETSTCPLVCHYIVIFA
jgi:hypothetical protein